MIRILSIQHSLVQIDIAFDDETSASFAPIWIREACGCALCRAPGTSFRLSGLRDLDSFVQATTVDINADGSALRCTWPDGHKTELAAGWLASQTTIGPRKLNPLVDSDRSSKKPEASANPSAEEHSGPTLQPSTSQHPWQSPFEPKRSSYQELATEEGHRQWLADLWQDGVAIVSEMPTTRAELTSFANRIGPVQPSNYGPDWEIEASANPTTRVYSQDGLAVHTDLPYRSVPPGVQFNLSVIANATGGAATVADGFAIADELRRIDPGAFELLTTVDFELNWLDADHNLKHRAPTITLDDDGNYKIFRYAPGLVAPICADPATIQATHQAYQRFTELAAEPRFQIAIRLKPGELLAMNNHRVLHGRQAFELRTGRRRLIGCYLDLDDLQVALQRQEPMPAR